VLNPNKACFDEGIIKKAGLYGVKWTLCLD